MKINPCLSKLQLVKVGASDVSDADDVLLCESCTPARI